MSMIQSDLLLGQEGGAGYTISRSLRFNSSDSAYCSRVFSSAGNRKTFTWAGWVKRSNIGGASPSLFGCQTGAGNPRDAFQFASDQLAYDANTTGSAWNVSVKTTQVFRDASAWYHIVLAVDTTQATAANRVRLYVNGSEVTAFTTATYPAQNTDLPINQAQIHYLGASTGSNFFDGYLADIHFIDGQALTPSSFTEVSATTGQLIPKQYTGSFGTNGFWLKFSDNSAATATTLGKDYSGNNNNWTPNNLSVTAGAGNDSLVDTPTNYGTDAGAGGEVRGNYATLNPLATGSTITLSNGNLDGSQTSTNTGTLGTIGFSSGKWYWEVTVNSLSGGTYPAIGIADSGYNPASNPGQANTWVYYGSGEKGSGAGSSSYGASYTTGDVIGVALDLSAGTLTFYKNGSSQGTAYSSLAAATYFPVIGKNQGNVTWSFSANFGQRPFAYTAPSGFKGLCTTNLPDPVVAQPSTVMDVKLYTGNGSTQTVSGLNFSPDWIWFKQRNTTRENHLYDSVRGVQKALYTDLTNAEATDTDALSSFNSDGWTMGADGGSNQNGGTYVAWCWDAGSSTVTNTQGSITSQVRANASAGFSIVTYTGTGSTATVGHGLGVAPALIITKPRSVGGTGWTTYHSALGRNKFLQLQATNAEASSTGVWGSAEPTSTVFGLGAADNNYSGATIVAYCFAPVAGYSSFGSYTGNGSADGPFVFCGFRPRWILIKRIDSVGSWWVFDAARTPYNTMTSYLFADLSNAETTDPTQPFDFTSNGFKLRTATYQPNTNGGTFVYAAFAENPFKYARAR